MRLAFVVQRYGCEINGGAELECRQMAERLSKHMDVEVLTTCAEDYHTWRNVYPAGEERINGVLVRRFEVDRERDIAKFDRFTGELMARKRTLTLSASLHFDEMRWMELQGPISSGLLQFLEMRQGYYDLFFFVTYMYASTFLGLQVVPHKSVMLATAHDDPWIRFGIFRPFFHLPRAFVFNSPEEQMLIRRLFRNDYIPGEVLGHGIDLRYMEETMVARAPEVFREETRVGPHDDYIIFVGRIDPSKGCDQLFEYFTRFKTETEHPVKLVLVGKPSMQIPEHPDIVPLGFMHESRYPWMARARALVLPSMMESLSLVVLESLGLKVPVLVNGHCEVTRGHCLRSNAGLYYYNYDEFAAALGLLLARSGLRQEMGQLGQAYVRRDYDWNVLEGRLVDWLNQIVRSIGRGTGPRPAWFTQRTDATDA
jgi:glycosyltransferase involved in cell wall biosynthesis